MEQGSFRITAFMTLPLSAVGPPILGFRMVCILKEAPGEVLRYFAEKCQRNYQGPLSLFPAAGARLELSFDYSTVLPSLILAHSEDLGNLFTFC